MITLKEAFVKASKDPSCSKIVEIRDAGDFWQFIDDLLDTCIGRCSIAVDKADGKLWYVWGDRLTDEQDAALEHAKTVPLPDLRPLTH